MPSLINRLIPSLSRWKYRRDRVRGLLQGDPDLKGRMSYAQDGEDLLLASLMDQEQPGFYVDIGAHHPLRLSNTYYFYLRGWRGINVDAAPGSMNAFGNIRPRDINVEKAISAVTAPLTFFQFNEPAVSTFDESQANRIIAEKRYHLTKQVELTSQPLSALLSQHLPPNQRINFLSVDVEGLDLEVLQSNDWQLYRPDWILAEIVTPDLPSMLQAPLTRYLSEIGYHSVSRTVRTGIFRRVD